MGDKVAAREIYRQALDIFDSRYGADNKTGLAMNRIAILLLLGERFNKDAAFRRLEGYDPDNKYS